MTNGDVAAMTWFNVDFAECLFIFFFSLLNVQIIWYSSCICYCWLLPTLFFRDIWWWLKLFVDNIRIFLLWMKLFWKRRNIEQWDSCSTVCSPRRFRVYLRINIWTQNFLGFAINLPNLILYPLWCKKIFVHKFNFHCFLLFIKFLIIETGIEDQLWSPRGLTTLTFGFDVNSTVAPKRLNWCQLMQRTFIVLCWL